MEKILFRKIFKNGTVLFVTEYRAVEQGWYDLLWNYPDLWDFKISRSNQKNIRIESEHIIVIETDDGKEYRMDLTNSPNNGDNL